MKEQNIDYLKLFASLPKAYGDYKITDEDAYNPNLYFYEGNWHVSWISCSEGDILLDFEGKTLEDAILKAHNEYSNFLKE